jgi:penicillin-binding protein 1A
MATGAVLNRALRLIARLTLGEQVRTLQKELSRLSALRRRFCVWTPKNLLFALVAAEDRRFFEHQGVDIVAIARACWKFLWRGQMEGASTLEQQHVRTVTARRERTLRRKVREILLANCVGEALGKSDVLEVYLSIAYFGWKMQGVARACGALGYELSTLSASQAADLVARLKYPEPRYRDAQWQTRVKKRVTYIERLLSRGRGVAECHQLAGGTNDAIPT